MRLKGHKFNLKQIICLILYYGFAIYLPKSGNFNNFGGFIRRFLCKRIFRFCGKKVNIERGAKFGRGTGISLGDYSGIGIDAVIPGNTIIGNYVMMGPNCHIFSFNHGSKDINIPMMFQGLTQQKQTIIEDDVWIGQNVMILPGRHISKGSIIGAGCVLTKDFPEYSVIGGNPSKLIRSRK